MFIVTPINMSKMNKKTYTMPPFNAKNVMLSERLNEICREGHKEFKRNMNSWAQDKELSEIEKVYDHNTSQKTLKLIILSIDFNYKIKFI